MSFRPICDTWILSRPKVKYYGAYPNGFLERAKVLLPVLRTEPVLHACGGSAKLYPTWAKYCPNDVTCDLDASLDTDLLWNVKRDGIPGPQAFSFSTTVRAQAQAELMKLDAWRGILIDPPYTEADADHYVPGSDELPSPKQLLRDALAVLVPGGRVGILHYIWPSPPKDGCKSIACIGVVAGFSNRKRVFSVFEKV